MKRRFNISQTLARKLSIAFRFIEAEDKEQLQKMLLDFKKDNPDGGLVELFECFSRMCADSSRPIVLMIDEVVWFFEGRKWS